MGKRMANPIKFPSLPTLCFTPEEAGWLALALESTGSILSKTLADNVEDPEKNEAFLAYRLLAERCRKFWLQHTKAEA
jgi:hypothetical protein